VDDALRTKGAYRFWDNEKVTPEKIRAPHRDKAVERAKEYGIVLAVQDTMEVELYDTQGNRRFGTNRRSWDARSTCAFCACSEP